MMHDEKAREYKPSLLGMINNPSEQFERMKKQPAFWGALVSIVVLTIVGTWLSLSGFNINAVTSVEELSDFTTEELAAFEILTKLTFIVIGLAGTLIKALIMTFLFLIFARSLQTEVSFKQLFSMNTYILFIVSLGIFINGFITTLVGADPESMFTSLGAFIRIDGIFGELLKNIELFEIWGLILTAIGLQKVAGYPKKVSWIIAVLFFVFTVILTITRTGAEAMAVGF